MEQTVFSVSELNRFVKALLDNVPPLMNICVRGEISNYKLYPSGHHYFTLKDAGGALRCVLFRGDAAHLRFHPENGQKILAFGRVTVYPRDGVYQLYVNEMLPEGAGDLHAAFEALKAKLDAEGLFDPAHKKALPPFPTRIALITSEAGAAVHDMIRILRARFPLTKVLLLPVRVQGAEAPPEIVAAVRYANRFDLADILIVGRGGGSLEDLWAFNDERVARAVYDSRIPVISAVGHEPDVTICDYVADVRAATPSHAAECAVPDRAELLYAFAEDKRRCVRALNRRVTAEREKLTACMQRRVLRDPYIFTQDKRQELDRLQSALLYAEGRQLSLKRERFSASSAALDAMSPLKVLSRGFGVVRTLEGKLLRRGRDAVVGDTLDVTLAEGGFTCEVKTVRGE